MRFQIIRSMIMLRTAEYVAWFRQTVQRQDVINHITQYREELEQLQNLRCKDVPQNAHWVPTRMEGCFDRLSFLEDRLDSIFTYTPEYRGFDGYQFPWMDLIQDKLIDRHTEREQDIMWVAPMPFIGEEKETPRNQFTREFFAKRDYARDVIYARQQKHSIMAERAAYWYAQASKIKTELGDLQDVFGELDVTTPYVAQLVGKHKNLRKKAGFHYAKAAEFKKARLDPLYKRYQELFPAEPKPSTIALNQDAKRESARLEFLDPYATEREMPGHRTFVCPVCCEDDRNFGTQYVESSYVDATCFNPQCPNHGEALMEVGEYKRMMGNAEFRESVEQLQDDYAELTHPDYLNARSRIAQMRLENAQTMNEGFNLLKRAQVRKQHNTENQEELDRILSA